MPIASDLVVAAKIAAPSEAVLFLKSVPLPQDHRSGQIFRSNPPTLTYSTNQWIQSAHPDPYALKDDIVGSVGQDSGIFFIPMKAAS